MLGPFNILVIYPHPADSATEASGTLAIHSEKGDRVTSVIVTHGDRHHMQRLADHKAMPQNQLDPALTSLTLGSYRNFMARESERVA